MSTDFDTFCHSDLGAFVESLLGERGCMDDCPEIPPPTGGCCISEVTGTWPGAMCRAKGQCLQDVTTEECETLNGTYAGDDNYCAREDCFTPPPPNPDPENEYGRCCRYYEEHYGGGTVNPVYRCHIKKEAECVEDHCSISSFYQNCEVLSWTRGNQCLPGENPPWPPGGNDWTRQACASRQGWCCLPGSQQIAWTTSDRCATDGGKFSTYSTPPSACWYENCCMPDVDGIMTCGEVQGEECEARGGCGAGPECEDITCGTGACWLRCDRCIDNTVQGQCQAIRGRSWQIGEMCDDALGACCRENGNCDLIAGAECERTGGQFRGRGTICEDQDCRTGACCTLDDDCIAVWSEIDCASQGGTFLGLGSACSSTTCLWGACCHVDGSCASQLTRQNCENVSTNTYMGGGTQCEDVDCIEGPGACCLPNGVCTSGRTRAWCENLWGLFGGGGSTCSDVDCAAGRGACCDYDPQPLCKENQTQGWCTSQGGTFKGYGRTCDGIVC